MAGIERLQEIEGLIRRRPGRCASGSPGGETRKESGNGTFDMLGFTHFWGKGRKGNWVVMRKTVGKRLRRSFKAVSQQHKTLCKKLQGHYGYYGIRLNYRAICGFASLRKICAGSRSGGINGGHGWRVGRTLQWLRSATALPLPVHRHG